MAIHTVSSPLARTQSNFSEMASLTEMDFDLKTQTALDVLTYPEWQKPVQEALIELDLERLQARIASAKTAVSRRLETIAQQEGHQAERQAIEDALAILRMLENQTRQAS